MLCIRSAVVSHTADDTRAHFEVSTPSCGVYAIIPAHCQVHLKCLHCLNALCRCLVRFRILSRMTYVEMNSITTSTTLILYKYILYRKMRMFASQSHSQFEHNVERNSSVPGTRIPYCSFREIVSRCVSRALASPTCTYIYAHISCESPSVCVCVLCFCRETSVAVHSRATQHMKMYDVRALAAFAHLR